MDKSRSLLVALIWLLSLPGGQAQKYDYTWVLGYEYGDTYPGKAEGNIIRFNDSPPSVTPYPIAYDMLGGAAMSHPLTGELMFYTNGCSVINSLHEVMENGEDLNPGLIHNVYCIPGPRAYYPTAQVIFALPYPGREGEYVLFHRLWSNNDVYKRSQMYSVIDMNANDGLGRVTEKNKQLIGGTYLAYGQASACKTADGSGWWVPVWSRHDPVCTMILLDSLGPRVHHKQTIGAEGPEVNGAAAFDPTGRHYVWYDLWVGVHAYDFDRETGMFSRPRRLIINTAPPYSASVGVSFSPSGKYVYLSARDSLYQLEHSLDDLASGLELIDTMRIPTTYGVSLTFSNSLLAPDCRIYITTAFTWKALSIIHHPDEKGRACGLEKLGLRLPFPNSNGSVPVHPMYRMDTDQICDPGISHVFPVEWYSHPPPPYPNPTTGLIHLSTSVTGAVTLYDQTGRRLMAWDAEAQHHTLDISSLAPGLYLLTLGNETGRPITHKIIKY